MGKLTEADLTKAERRRAKSDADVARIIEHASLDGNGCWIWSDAKRRAYGFMLFRGKTWRAHGVSYTLFCGEIPEGLLVCHHCDVPQCVNPKHLFLGHHTVNVKDMVRKGRSRSLIDSSQSHFKSGRAPFGEQASGSRMSEMAAKEIIQRAAAGELTISLAKDFGVGRRTIQDLLKGRTWSYLDRPPGIPRRVGVYGRRALEEGAGR